MGAIVAGRSDELLVLLRLIPLGPQFDHPESSMMTSPSVSSCEPLGAMEPVGVGSEFVVAMMVGGRLLPAGDDEVFCIEVC